ncbi:MAG: ESPR-type extended signal peptide-containing protein, partial [Betaproteobacteria bacterium]
MNHIYRLIYSDLTRTWVAVAEIARGRGKRSSGTVGHTPRLGGTGGAGGAAGLTRNIGVKILAASLALIGAPVHALDVNALPKGGSVVAGSAAISQSANTLTVQQSSQRA